MQLDLGKNETDMLFLIVYLQFVSELNICIFKKLIRVLVSVLKRCETFMHTHAHT